MHTFTFLSREAALQDLASNSDQRGQAAEERRACNNLRLPIVAKCTDPVTMSSNLESSFASFLSVGCQDIGIPSVKIVEK